MTTPTVERLPATPAVRGQGVVAMLRAVNVGGRNRLPMARLQEVAARLGHLRVQTHLQSGNLVCWAAGEDLGGFGRGLRSGLSAEGLPDVPVLVRSADQMVELVRRSPLAKAAIPQRFWHLTFLDSDPDPALVAAIDPSAGDPDRFWVSGREVYLGCPGGYGSTRLSNSFLERKLKVVGTTRNWATVLRLTEMAVAAGSAQPPETAGIT